MWRAQAASSTDKSRKIETGPPPVGGGPDREILPTALRVIAGATCAEHESGNSEHYACVAMNDAGYAGGDASYAGDANSRVPSAIAASFAYSKARSK